MNEMTEKVSETVKQQMDQANSTFNEWLNAAKGLIVKMTQSSTEQFESLVKAGEGKKISEEIKSAFGEFNDPKESANQIRYAAIGLFSKTKETSNKYLKEFAEIGEGKTKKKAPSTPSKSTAKKAKAA